MQKASKKHFECSFFVMILLRFVFNVEKRLPPLYLKTISAAIVADHPYDANHLSGKNLHFLINLLHYSVIF